MQSEADRQKTDFMYSKDLSVENLSRSRVLLASTPKSKEDMEQILKPTTVKDKETWYRTKDGFNLKYIVNGDNEDERDEIYH